MTQRWQRKAAARTVPAEPARIKRDMLASWRSSYCGSSGQQYDAGEMSGLRKLLFAAIAAFALTVFITAKYMDIEVSTISMSLGFGSRGYETRSWERTCEISPGIAPPLYDLPDSCVGLHCYPDCKLDIEQPYRILWLTSLKEYETYMSRHFFYQYDAAVEHPCVDPSMWGPGFSGWNDDLTVKQNLEALHNAKIEDVPLDLIYVYSNFVTSKDVVEVSSAIPIAHRKHECFDSRCTSMFRAYNLSLAFFAYAPELRYYEEYSYRRVVANIPTAAEPKYFYPGERRHPVKSESPFCFSYTNVPQPPTIERNIDVLLVGATTASVYPLRARFESLIKDGKIPGGYQRTHPGYRIAADGDLLTASLSQVTEYADDLKRAKIVVLDSSKYRYALGKYIEAAMAGALLIGDIPLDREDEFRQFVVEVNVDDSDAKILETVQYWLDHEEERNERALLGQKIVLSKYTWGHAIDQVVMSLTDYRNGWYGMRWPYSYSQRCAATNLKLGVDVNPWCPGVTVADVQAAKDRAESKAQEQNTASGVKSEKPSTPKPASNVVPVAAASLDPITNIKTVLDKIGWRKISAIANIGVMDDGEIFHLASKHEAFVLNVGVEMTTVQRIYDLGGIGFHQVKRNGALPIAGGSVDIALVHASVWSDDTDAFRKMLYEWNRIVRPDGHLILIGASSEQESIARRNAEAGSLVYSAALSTGAETAAVNVFHKSLTLVPKAPVCPKWCSNSTICSPPEVAECVLPHMPSYIVPSSEGTKSASRWHTLHVSNVPDMDRFFTLSNANSYLNMTYDRITWIERLNNIEKFVPLSDTRVILDSGCGAGGFQAAIADRFGTGHQVFAYEYAPWLPFHRIIGERGFPSTVFDATVPLPVPDNSYDFIWSMGMLHFWKDRPSTFISIMKEYDRTTKPGGYIVLADPLDRDTLKRAATELRWTTLAWGEPEPYYYYFKTFDENARDDPIVPSTVPEAPAAVEVSAESMVPIRSDAVRLSSKQLTALNISSAGVSNEDVMGMLRSVYGRRCSPPWDSSAPKSFSCFSHPETDAVVLLDRPNCNSQKVFQYLNYFFGPRNIFVVVNDPSACVLVRRYGFSNVRCTGRDFVVPSMTYSALENVARELSTDEDVIKRTGWYMQQFVKFGVGFRQGVFEDISSSYMVWDGDLLPVNGVAWMFPYGDSSAGADGDKSVPQWKSFMCTGGYPDERRKRMFQVGYHTTYAALIGEPFVGLPNMNSYVAGWQLLNSTVVEEMMRHIEKRFEQEMPWFERILRVALDPNRKTNYIIGFSEFDTYGSWITTRHPEQIVVQLECHRGRWLYPLASRKGDCCVNADVLNEAHSKEKMVLGYEAHKVPSCASAIEMSWSPPVSNIKTILEKIGWIKISVVANIGALDDGEIFALASENEAFVLNVGVEMTTIQRIYDLGGIGFHQVNRNGALPIAGGSVDIALVHANAWSDDMDVFRKMLFEWNRIVRPDGHLIFIGSTSEQESIARRNAEAVGLVYSAAFSTSAGAASVQVFHKSLTLEPKAPLCPTWCSNSTICSPPEVTECVLPHMPSYIVPPSEGTKSSSRWHTLRLPNVPDYDRFYTLTNANSYLNMTYDRITWIQRLNNIEMFVPLSATPVILDSGCGAGGFQAAIADRFGTGHQVFAYEYSPWLPFHRIIGERGFPSTVFDATIPLPVPDNSYDFIWSMGMLHFWKDRPSTFISIMEEYDRTTKPGGYIVLADPLDRDTLKRAATELRWTTLAWGEPEPYYYYFKTYKE